jgi:urease accessory protein
MSMHPPLSGQGVLEFSRADHRTVVTRALAHSPLRLFSTRSRGTNAHVVITSYGGGLLGGDTLSLRVVLRPHAHAFLSTQASTKVYGSPRLSRQELSARVETGALLVVVPDPLVPYARSRFVQHQAFELAAGGSLVLVDWVSGGRWARGERWALDRYESRIELGVDGTPILAETLLLEPESGGLPGRFGAFSTLATVVLAGPATAEAARRLLVEVAVTPARTDADMLLGASPLGEHGAIIRFAATSTERARREIRRLLAFVPPLLGDDPWTRDGDQSPLPLREPPCI